nr:MAG TPA: Baseplate J like protein [Caudoviricetes sp.]
MYENQTYDLILQRVLGRSPDNLDKRYSSFLYNSSAPVAVEIQNMFIALDNILNLTFFDTADRAGKLERCRERGIELTRFAATYSVVTAKIEPQNVDVPIGTRFNYDTINFVVVEKIGAGLYRMKCETLGEAGNVIGVITPIDFIRNLSRAEIISIDVYGEEEASIDEIDKAFYATLNSSAFGGNRADYLNKVHAIPGVGGVKCYSAAEWMGGGTVKLVIQTSSFTVPSNDFVNQVQTIIDPLVNQGAGYGVAPIGHTVTVAGVTETTVNISAKITLKDGYEWADVSEHIASIITDYFDELNRDWENNRQIIVRISQVETRILDVVGILDIENTYLNGQTSNLYIDKDAIAVKGEITNAGA